MKIFQFYQSDEVVEYKSFIYICGERKLDG